jgi:hypothetical protein
VLRAQDRIRKVGIGFALPSLVGKYRGEQKMAPNQKTQPKNQLKKFEEQFSAHVRARYPLLYLSTPEEVRAEKSIARLCRRGTGLQLDPHSGRLCSQQTDQAELADPMAVLRWYEALDESILILKFRPFTERTVRGSQTPGLGAETLKQQPKNIVLLSPKRCVRSLRRTSRF